LEYANSLYEFDNGPLLDKIEIPVLITKAEDDEIAGQAELVYDRLTNSKNKSIIKFSKKDGAEEHCETGARMFYSEKVYSWIDTILSGST